MSVGSLTSNNPFCQLGQLGHPPSLLTDAISARIAPYLQFGIRSLHSAQIASSIHRFDEINSNIHNSSPDIKVSSSSTSASSSPSSSDHRLISNPMKKFYESSLQTLSSKSDPNKTVSSLNNDNNNTKQDISSTSNSFSLASLLKN